MLKKHWGWGKATTKTTPVRSVRSSIPKPCPSFFLLFPFFEDAPRSSPAKNLKSSTLPSATTNNYARLCFGRSTRTKYVPWCCAAAVIGRRPSAPRRSTRCTDAFENATRKTARSMLCRARCSSNVYVGCEFVVRTSSWRHQARHETTISTFVQLCCRGTGSPAKRSASVLLRKFVMR